MISQLVMGCDLVSTVLFVFCQIVSTISMKEEDGTERKLVPDSITSGIEITCVIWIISKLKTRSKTMIVRFINENHVVVHYVSGMLVAEQRIKYMASFMPLVDSCIVLAFLLDVLIQFVFENPPKWVRIPLQRSDICS